MRKAFTITATIVIMALTALILWMPNLWWMGPIIIPFPVLGFVDYFQKSVNVKRNYPLLRRTIHLPEKQLHAIQETVLLNRTVNYVCAVI